MPIALVIFDIAGTIIHDRGEVSAAFVETMRQHGFFITGDDVLEWKGAGKRSVIAHLLTKARRIADTHTIETIHRDFVSTLHRIYDGGALRAIEGAEATFAALRQRGFKLGVTTGFGRLTMQMILDRLGWSHWFPVQISTEDVAQGRPAPDMIFEVMQRSGISDPLSVANVGDTPLDLQSAAAAGVALNIGVLSGMHSRERLESEPHNHLLASIREVPELVIAE